MILRYETGIDDMIASSPHSSCGTFSYWEKRRALFGRTELEIKDDWLLGRAEEPESRLVGHPYTEKEVPWDFVERIASGPEHDFISLWGGVTITIPRFRLDLSEYESFMAELKRKCRDHGHKAVANDQDCVDRPERLVLSEAPPSPILDALAKRRKWFEAHTNYNTCPCCGYPTLGPGERGEYIICRICRWEDDGQDDPDSYEIEGGPNYEYSLAEARWNFYHHYSMYHPKEANDRYPEGLERWVEKVKRVMTAYGDVILEQSPKRKRAALRRAVETEATILSSFCFPPRCSHHSEITAISFNERTGEWLCWDCADSEHLPRLK